MRDDIELLIDEVRLLFHRLVQVGETLHGGGGVTLGMRGVLEYLVRHGPTTVPEIARSRFVTRQHIQALVNGLLEQGLVELIDNPAHKRSFLVRLTQPGEETIRQMRAREAEFYRALELPLGRRDLERAAGLLRLFRDALGEQL